MRAFDLPGIVSKAFRLGQRQAREEQKEKEENELNLRRIDALKLVIKHLLDYLDIFPFVNDEWYPTIGKEFNQAGKNLRTAIYLAVILFPGEQDSETHQQLMGVRQHIIELGENPIIHAFMVMKHLE